jgi:hypothetical protein
MLPPVSRTTPLGCPVVPDVYTECRADDWRRRARTRRTAPADRIRPAARRGRPAAQRPACLALHDDAVAGLCTACVDRRIQQGLVGDNPVGFDTAGGRQYDVRPRIVDTHGQLIAGETTEDHRVDGAETRTGQHADNRFGDHRHVDQHAIAAAYAALRQHTRAARHRLQQLGVGVAGLRGGDRAVDQQRFLRTAAIGNVIIEGVVAGVGYAVRVPAVKGRPAVIEERLRRGVPVDGAGGLHPIDGVGHDGLRCCQA